MAYTIAQYKNFVDEGLSPVVIDEIRRNSALLDAVPVTDNGAFMGDKWTYAYKRKESMRSAAVRLINTEYTPAIISPPTKYTVDLAIGGGSFTIDRVMGENNGEFMADNFADATTASVQLAHDLMINGDTGNAGEPDGLDVILAGSTTEYNVDKVTDLSTTAASDTSAREFKRDLGKWFGTFNGKPDMIMANSALLPIVSDLIDEWGAGTRTSDDFGREFDTYRGTTIVDIGDKPGSSDPVIPIEDRTVDGNAETGLTDIYAVRFGPQQFHLVSPNDKSRFIRAYVPNWERPGTVHLGEVEFVFAPVLEETRAAGVFRNVKVEV